MHYCTCWTIHLQRLRVLGKNKVLWVRIKCYAKCYALVFKYFKDLHSSFRNSRSVLQFAPYTPIVLIPNGSVIKL